MPDAELTWKVEEMVTVQFDPIFAKIMWKEYYHHERFKKRVATSKLICQEGGGIGGWNEYPAGPFMGALWMECGWCEGTGRVTPLLRGQWLKYKRQERRGG
jgi:hypothetical protein